MARLVLWTAINIFVASVAGCGGARMRVRFEPVLLLFAAVVLAGTWRRPGRGWIAASLVTCSAAAAAVLPQIPRSLEGWHWSQDSGRHPSTPAAPEPAARAALGVAT